MKVALTVWVIIVFLLHQDFWNWTSRSLVFGFVPVGLAYHAGYAILASVTMAILVHFLWPKELEEVENLPPPESAATSEARP